MIETEFGKFTDRVNPETMEVLDTAQQVYENYLANKDKQIDICPTKTTEQKIEELIGQVSFMDELIANLTLEVVENE